MLEQQSSLFAAIFPVCNNHQSHAFVDGKLNGFSTMQILCHESSREIRDESGDSRKSVIFLHLQMSIFKRKKTPLEFFTDLNPVDASQFLVLPSYSHVLF